MKKILIWASVILVALFFGLQTWLYPNGDLSEYTDKVTKEAVAANDVSICEKLAGELLFNADPRTRCYAAIAIQRKDLNVCADFRDWMCFADYFSHYQTNDANLCAVIETQEARDYCFSTQHLHGYDIALCAHIEKDSEQANCYINQMGHDKNTGICEQYLSGADADRCYVHAALVFRDKVWCEKVQDAVQKQSCIDEQLPN